MPGWCVNGSSALGHGGLYRGGVEITGGVVGDRPWTPPVPARARPPRANLIFMWGCAGAEAGYVACAKGPVGHSGLKPRSRGTQ